MTTATRRTRLHAPADIAYDFLRNVENYRLFLEGVDEVRPEGAARARWKARRDDGLPLEWGAEFGFDPEDREIAWKAASTDVPYASGVVQVMARGSEAEVVMTVECRGGRKADLESKLATGLDRFKEIVERSFSASGMADAGEEGEALGTSLGATTEEDLKRIEHEGEGTSPTEVDDPALR